MCPRDRNIISLRAAHSANCRSCVVIRGRLAHTFGRMHSRITVQGFNSGFTSLPRRGHGTMSGTIPLGVSRTRPHGVGGWTVTMVGGGNGGNLPPVSATSLPSIVFVVLFFFVMSAAVHSRRLLIECGLPRTARIRGLRGGSLIDCVRVKRPSLTVRTGFNATPHVRLGSSCGAAGSVLSFITTRHSGLDRTSHTSVAVYLGTSRAAGVNVMASIGRRLHHTGTLGISCTTSGSLKCWGPEGVI